MRSLFSQTPSAATVLLTLLVLWAPLPYASVTPAGLFALRLASFLALGLALWRGEGKDRLPELKIPIWSLLVIALIGLLQAIPLPRLLVGWLSPARLELAEEAAEIAAGGGVGAVALSLAPSQSISTALTFAGVAAALAAGAMVGGERRQRRWLLGGLLASVLFQLLYGFRHMAAGSNSIWGLEVGRAGDRMRGTFVNPAHLAPYLEMSLAVIFALGWWAIRRARRSKTGLERRLTIALGPVLLWLLVFAGLALTRSRAALLAVVLATLAQGVALAVYRRRWRLLPVGLVAVGVGIALVAWTGLERGLGRLLGTSAHSLTANIRLEVWRATSELWRRFPVAGTGLGSFESTFPMVETEEMAVVSWEHAHNDWLELLSTGGSVALAAAVVGLVFLIRRLHSVLVGSRSQEATAAALAGLGALIAVGFHELLDFGLTLPANSFTLAVLLGVSAAGDGGLDSE